MERQEEVVKTIANSVLLVSAGVSALGDIPPDLFNEEESETLAESLRSFEEGRERLVELVTRLHFFDDKMKIQLLGELQTLLDETAQAMLEEELSTQAAS